MAYVPHLLLTFGGRIVGSAGNQLETWTCGLRLSAADASSGSPSVETGALVYYANQINTWFLDNTTGISSAATLDRAKLNWISPSGRYTNPYTNEYVFTTPSVGGGGAVKFPPQIAYCVSLRTANRGPRARGRFYIPCPIGPLQSTTLGVSTTTAGYIAGTTKTMINAINAGTGVWSGATTKPKVSIVSKSGDVTPVTEVWCGAPLDTIRDRRKALDEAYVKVSL